MAESTICKTKRDGTLTILDNGGANSYVISFEAGDLSIDIPGPGVNVFLDRGALGSTPCLRYGDDQPMSGSFTAHMRDVSDATDVSLIEFLAESGQVASTFVSTLGANAEVRTYTLRWDIEGTDHGDAADHRIECNFCAISGSVGEGDPNTVNISFTSYDLYPTVT